MVRTTVLRILLAGLLLVVSSSSQTIPPQGAAHAQSAAAGTWQGRVEALVLDNFQTGSSRTRYFLHTASETLELQVEGTANLRSGQAVEATGRIAGRRIIAARVTALDSGPAPSACAATGEQKMLVILASFPSKALFSSVTPALVEASFFGAGRTLNTFLLESSYGQTSITGNVVGPYVLDADYLDQPLSVRDAALRAASPFTNLTQYNRIFVVAPQGQTGMDSGGMALLGCGQVPSPQGTLDASSIWMGAESMVGQDAIVDIASHETGHAFGLEHARFADYSGEPLGPAGQAPAPWDSLHEYGDSFSSMGRNSAQWAAPHKSWLGWLQAGTNIQTVNANGTFTIRIDSVQQNVPIDPAVFTMPLPSSHGQP